MKVQLQGQALRLRIDERELALLLQGETVVNQTRLDDVHAWSQSLRLEAGDVARLAHGGDGLHLALPRREVEALRARLPSREGLEFLVGQGAWRLEIRFDVDVRDSVRERGPSAGRRR